MLRVILDTNVFVAGYLSKNKLGYPSKILNSWRSGKFTLIMSPQILREIIAKLTDKGVEDELLRELIFTIGKAALFIPGAYETYRLHNIDPDDNIILAAALESNADYIVSYDKESLLPMKHYHRTQIVTAEIFVRQLAALAENSN